MNQQDTSLLSEFRDDRAAKDVAWTSSIEDKAREAARIKKVLAPSAVKHNVRQPAKKSLFSLIFD